MLLKPSNRRPIEIILGGWSNSNSCLRTRVQGPCRDQYDGDILDCKEFKEFVISWKDGGIMVGHMNSGFRDLMLDLQLKNLLSDVTIWDLYRGRSNMNMDVRRCFFYLFFSVIRILYYYIMFEKS